MKQINDPLSLALGETATIKILSFFLSSTNCQYTKKEIAKAVNISNQTIYKAIIPLEEFNIINKSRKVGNTFLYSLNTDSKSVKTIKLFNRSIVQQLISHEQSFLPEKEVSPIEFLHEMQR